MDFLFYDKSLLVLSGIVLHGSWYNAVFLDENNVRKQTNVLGFAEQSLH